MSFLSNIADSAKAAAKSASEYTKKTIADLKAPPASVQCSGCPRQVEVPKNLFDWVCSNNHNNDRTVEKCATCGGDKWTPPDDKPKTVTCPDCNAVTEVPNTAAQRHLKQAAYDTKTAIQKGAVSAQESFVKMKSAPEQFHCSVCDTLLFVPKGPWLCQACGIQSNEENSPSCANPACTQKKTQQKVQCGVCNQAVLVPTSNLMNSLGHMERQMSSGVKKAFYTIADKPHVNCPRCKKQVLIPEDKTAPAASDESKEDANGKPTNIIPVTCQACQEKILVQRVSKQDAAAAAAAASSSESTSSSASSSSTSSTPAGPTN